MVSVRSLRIVEYLRRGPQVENDYRILAWPGNRNLPELNEQKVAGIFADDRYALAGRGMRGFWILSIMCFKIISGSEANQIL
jgi:hypothetical protein